MLRSSTPRQISASHASTAASSPAMRRKRKDTECMLKLDRVLGLTSNKPMILSVNSGHDLVAYAAGCVVVLYNHKLDKQVGLLCSSTLKRPNLEVGSAGTGSHNLSNNNMLGAGQRGIASSLGGSPRTALNAQWMNNPLASPNINPLAGLMPMALSDPSIASSFGLSTPSSNKNIKPKPISCLSFSPDGQFLAIGETGHQPRILIWEVASQLLVAELQGHKFGVQAIQFSPNSKHLVSLGFQHDGYIHIWNWRTGLQTASNKVTTKVNALAFSKDGSYFVTAGLRHIKFWYLNSGSGKKSSSATAHNVQVIDGRAGILGELRDSNYVDTVCSQDGRFTYAITSNGILCLFSENRVLEKWIDLHVRGAYSINLTEDGRIVCACTDGIIRLFETDTLLYIVTLPKPSPIGSFTGAPYQYNAEQEQPDAAFSDVLATQYDSQSKVLIGIYSDRSLVVWDLEASNEVKLLRSHLAHSDCVWGVEVVPESTSPEGTSQFSSDTFATYAADGSIRFWRLDDGVSMGSPVLEAPLTITTDEASEEVLPSREIVKVLYVDENCVSSIQPPENNDVADPGFNTPPPEFGIRTVKFSPDGLLLASGDKGGNLRVHDLPTFRQVTYQEAHESEILTIDFTEPESDSSPYLVATAGRDRLLHIFDVQRQYALLQTLDDHSSSITCIKFTGDGTKLMSCGADKSIIFRTGQQTDEGLAFMPYHQAPGRATCYDMNLHGPSNTLSVVSGDRRFNIFAVETGKSIKSFKAETKGDDLTAGMAEVCSMTHISLDPSGTIAAASGSDKSVRIYDLLHGTCLAHMICHSELVTDVKFASTYDRIISTSADGCILVWKLSRDLCKRIQLRTRENVTLPSYLASKALEVSLSTQQLPKPVGASPATLKPKRSTDRLVAHSGEISGSSRRSSTASVMSDDFDFRSEGTAGDAKDVQQTSRRRERTKSQDPGSFLFTPIVSAKSVRPSPSLNSGMMAPQFPVPISRAKSPVSKTPLNRSRQNSTTQPARPRVTSLSRMTHSAEIVLPAWNRNFVKERANTPSQINGTKSSRPPSPGRRVNDRQIPTGIRPRASSMTVAEEKTLPKFPEPKGTKANSAIQEQRHSLSDNCSMDPMPTAGSSSRHGTGKILGEDDDDEASSRGGGISDDTESGINDDLELSCSKVTSPAAPIEKEPLVEILVETTAQGVDDEDLTGNEATSEDRDREDDDDEAEEGDEESISETGSDNNEPEVNVSTPNRLRTPTPFINHGSNIRNDDGESLSPLRIISSSFHEGEILSPSPKRPTRLHLDSTRQSASPKTNVSSRTNSLRTSNSGRSSLSSKFLTAHAVAIMMGMAQQRQQQPHQQQELETETSSNDKGSQDGHLAHALDAESDAATPKALFSQSESAVGDQDSTTEQSSKHQDQISEDHVPATNGTSSSTPISLDMGENPRSLKYQAVARKRKQRSLSSGSFSLGGRLHIVGSSTPPSNIEEIDVTETTATQMNNLKDKNHVRTSLQSIAEPEDVDSPGGILSPSVSVDTGRISVPEDFATAACQDHHRVLASPVDVGSPVSTMDPGRGRHLSRIKGGDREEMTMVAESLDQALARACERSCSRPPKPSSSLSSVLASPTATTSMSMSRNDIRDQETATLITGETNGECNGNEESLAEAFERLSFLISYKANQANRVNRLHRLGKDTGDGDIKAKEESGHQFVQGDPLLERLEREETMKWMKETRDGLLSLVGQVQGHLWQLESDAYPTRNGQ